MKITRYWGFLSAFILIATLRVSAQEQKIQTPVMGWSSWNTYRVNIDENLIKKQADAMVTQGLQEVGYTYVNIDDGFFGWRDEEGTLNTHSERFPNGLKSIVDYIHSKRLKAGIYSDAGSNTCGSIWDNDLHGIGVGFYGHEKKDADLFFNKWGFDYVKIDYCGAGQQLELEEKKRYTEIFQAIKEVCSRDIRINICRWAYPGTWVKDMAHSWRISPDITPDWKSVKAIIRKNLYLSAYAGEGHYNDMDMLEVGRGLSPEEEEVHFGMWCVMSSPLMIGCDLTTIPESSLNLLKNKELIELNQDTLGLQAYVVQHEKEGYVLVKDIEQKRGNVRAVALYNPSEEICDFDVDLSLLELGGKLKMRDLIKQQDISITENRLTYQLSPHSVKIFRLEAEKRLEPKIYEAEWAYLNLYNDLGKQRRNVTYISYEGASGGMIVSNLGGQSENYAEWKEVYSATGGVYNMCIHYVPVQEREREINDRRLEVEVNGKKVMLTLPERTSGRIATLDLPVNLQAGYNVVRMGCPYTWTPDIDCFILEKIE